MIHAIGKLHGEAFDAFCPVAKYRAELKISTISILGKESEQKYLCWPNRMIGPVQKAFFDGGILLSGEEANLFYKFIYNKF